MRSRMAWLTLALAFVTLAAVTAAHAQQFTITRTFSADRIASGQSSVDFLGAGLESPPADASPPGTSMTLFNYTVSSNSVEEDVFPEYPFTLTILIRDLTTTNPVNTATIVYRGTVSGRVSRYQDNINVRLSGPAEVSFLIGDSVYSVREVQSTVPPISNDFNNPGACSANVYHSPAGRTILAVAQSAVRSAPTVVDGVAYFGADDGRLHAVDTTDGTAAPGFPIETPLAGSIRSRAAVYAGADGKGVYLTTDQGYVAKVGSDGRIVWSVRPLGEGSTSRSTPAVTPDGDVYVGIRGAEGARLVHLSDSDGRTVRTSPVLSAPNGIISSPSVSGGRVFVGLVYGTTGDIAVLDASTLTVLSAGVASGEGVTAPPYVLGASMYVGTRGLNLASKGRFYKLNSATAAPDEAFGDAGAPGSVSVGEPLAEGAFPVARPGTAGTLFYAGSTVGRVWSIDAQTGERALVINAGGNQALTAVTPSGDGSTLAFGTSGGSFFQVPLADPSSASAVMDLGAIWTAPAFDRAGNRFLVGSDVGRVYAFPVR